MSREFRQEEEEEEEELPCGDIAFLDEADYEIVLRRNRATMKNAQLMVAITQSLTEYLQYCQANDSTSISELCRFLNIPPTNLFEAKLTSEVMMPAFYLAVDDRHERIVLAIRGTKNMTDVVSDSALVPIAFECNGTHGRVHMGFLLACNNIFNEVFGTIRHLKEAYPQYHVRVVGHSLGGAVAVLLALKLRSVIPGTRAVVFGCPRCISDELIGETKSCVTCVVNDRDPCPRINLTEIMGFTSSLLLGSILPLPLAMSGNYTLPGNVLHLVPSSARWIQPSDGGCADIENIPASGLTGSAIDAFFFEQHYITAYSASLESLM